MKVCTCFLLFTIFAYTYSAAEKPTSNKRTLNLALKTVVEFDNKDETDVKFLNNVQQFISKVKTVMDRHKNRKQHLRREFREPKVNTFTDFIQEAIHILNGYKDDAFEDFFKILDDEIRKYHYRGCKFYELTENYDTRRLLAAKLDLIKGKPVAVTKANINILADILKDEIYDRNVKEFLDYINSLYRQDSEHKFQKVLTELDKYGKSKAKRNYNNLVKIVRDGVRSIIFNHYTDLNTNARRELKNKIETFWNQFKGTAKARDVTHTITNKTKISENKITVGKDLKPIRNYTEITKENKRKDISRLGDDSQSLTDEKTIEIHIKDSNYEHQKHSKYISSEKIFSSDSFEGNSIEFSLERQQEYNRQRYVTLYTESITLTPRNTTKKKKKTQWKNISPRESKSSSKHRSKHKVKHTTKSVTEFDIHETKPTPKLKIKKSEKELKLKKYDIARAMPKYKNARLFSEHDAIIDVQAGDIKIEEHERRLDQVRMDEFSSSDISSDSDSEHTKPTRFTTPTTPVHPRRKAPRIIRLQAQLREKPTRMTSYNPTTRSAHTIQYRYKDFRKTNPPPLWSNEGLSIEEFKRERDVEGSLRRSPNHTSALRAAELIVINRINELEKEINEVKNKMNNNTDEVNITNVTDKSEAKDENKGSDVNMKLVNVNVDPTNAEQFEKEAEMITSKTNKKSTNNITKATQTYKQTNSVKTPTGTTRNKPISISSTSSSKPYNFVKKNSSNTTVDGKKNNMPKTTSKVFTGISKTFNVTSNVTEKLTKDTVNNNKQSTVNTVNVKNTTKLLNVVRSSARTRRVLAYSSPPIYSDFDPFDHVKFGLDDKLYERMPYKIKNEFG